MNLGGQSPRPRITTPFDAIQRIFNALRDIVQVGRAASPILAVPSAALTAVGTTTITLVTDPEGNVNAFPIYVDWCDELAVDVNVSAISGTGATYTLAIDRLGADGVWYPIYTGTGITAIGKQSATLGVGASTNVGFGAQIQIRETVAGTTPSITRSISIIGK